MDIAIIGVKYCEETAKLIKENYCDVNIDIINLTSEKFSKPCADMYIITDRLCAGLKLKPDMYINMLNDLMKNIRKDDIALINFDDENLIRHLSGLDCNIISYGFNLKSTVTLSGTEEDIFTGQIYYTCSLQRSIKTIDKNDLEPCEMKLLISDQYNQQSILAYCAFCFAANLI